MRHRSKTNSRPWENLDVRYTYMQSNPFCEMSPWLVQNLRTEFPGLRHQETATDPHHIFGGAGRRVDSPYNLLAICRQVHRWAHSHLPDSRVVAMHIKLTKGEFDADEFRKISGKYIGGWLLMQRPHFEAVDRLRQKLIEKIG